MLSKIHRPTECRCVIEYDGDYFSPSKVEGKVCDTHQAIGLSIVEVHANYVLLAKERVRVFTEIHALADTVSEMKEDIVQTNDGTIIKINAISAQIYPEDTYPRHSQLKAEYHPVTRLKDDGSFEVTLPESDKKAVLEAALSK